MGGVQRAACTRQRSVDFHALSSWPPRAKHFYQGRVSLTNEQDNVHARAIPFKRDDQSRSAMFRTVVDSTSKTNNTVRYV